MVDISAIAGVASSLKAASDLTKAAIGLRDAEAIRNTVIELQSEILSAQGSAMSAQSAQFTLTERIRELEKEISILKEWDVEKSLYELKAVDTGSLAYVPKAGMKEDEPPHWLCANCFNRRTKSFLQFRGQDLRPGGARGELSAYGCDNCKSQIKVYYTVKPGRPKSAPAT